MERVTLTPEQQMRVDKLNLELAEIRVRLVESRESLWDPGAGPDNLQRAKEELTEARARVDRWSANSPPLH
jgi:hypothetical protein